MNTMYKKMTLLLLALLTLLIPYPLFAADNAVKIQMEQGKAEVTLLQGNAFLMKQGATKKQSLAQGDMLSQGDRISTAKNSRVELKLPDNSYLRFDENTSFVLESVSADAKTGDRDINVKMMLGKTWAKVSKLFKGKGDFAISTKTAVAGVRGTDFRMDVNSDNSAVLKVYSGAVEVSKKTELESSAPPSPAPQGIFTQFQPVAGPHPVSMKEWTYIVTSLQQINISSDGTATKPFRFDIKADLNEWVRWNQMRDEQIRKMQEEQMQKMRDEQIRKLKENQITRETPAAATEPGAEENAPASLPDTSVPDTTDTPPAYTTPDVSPDVLNETPAPVIPDEEMPEQEEPDQEKIDDTAE